MTPQQKRLLHPLTPQTPVQQLKNAIKVCLLCWPWSIVHAAAIEYCTTVSSRLDPLPSHAITRP